MLNVDLKAYDIDSCNVVIQPISNGLINKTWKVPSDGKSFILQRINTNIFPEPFKIAENINKIELFLKVRHPNYLLVCPIHNYAHNSLTTAEDSVYRLIPFIEKSQTIDSVFSAGQAYEASLQFGKFTTVLA